MRTREHEREMIIIKMKLNALTNSLLQETEKDICKHYIDEIISCANRIKELSNKG